MSTPEPELHEAASEQTSQDVDAEIDALLLPRAVHPGAPAKLAAPPVVQPRLRWRAAVRAQLQPLAAAALTGLVGACAFPLVIHGVDRSRPLFAGLPRELGIVICAAGLYAIIRSRVSLGQRMLRAGVAGFAFFVLLLYWLDIAMVRYGGMPQWQAVPVLLLLAGYCGLYWAALPAVHTLLARRLGLAGPVAFACGVVFLEWLRTHALTGFPWGVWGYSQTRDRPLLAWAGLTGVYGISWLIAYVGAWSCRLWRRRQLPGVGRQAAAVATLLVLVFAGGGLRLVMHRAAPATKRILVGVAQGNIDEAAKLHDVQNAAQIRQRYQKLTATAKAAGAQLVVWPEAAWPGNLEADLPRMPGRPDGVPVLFGASTFELRDRGGHWAGVGRAFNSAFWADADGRIRGRYDKRHLVPFGEYVPLRWLLPVDKFVTGMTDYSAGESAAPIGTPPFGVLICYDGVFPSLARQSVRDGAQVLANLTNDAWYGVSSAPYQHRDFYIMRAVETDRWVVRAANTGLSVFIDPTGGLHHETRLDQTTLDLGRIAPRTTRTPYVLLGDWPALICIGLVLVALLLRLRAQIRRLRAS